MFSTFSTKLEYDFVELYETSDAVRFSFIVQNSISYLNLDLGEYSKVGNGSSSALDIFHDFVSTEEKCRKIFTTSRRLLYTLHLDIPAGREHSLKNDLPFTFPSYLIPQHLARISLNYLFYPQIISKLIECAFKSTDQTLQTLAFLLKSPFLKIYLRHVNIHVMNKFIIFFYPNICDSLLFKSFIEVLNLSRWMGNYENPEILEFLLYHARYYGRDIEKECNPMSILVDNCIYRRVFLNIKPNLKYADTSGFCLEAYDLYVLRIKDFRPNLTDDLLTKAETLFAPKRIYLNLQILWIYSDSSRHQCIEAASEALRLLWNSFPDPFITLEEVEIVFAGILSHDEIRGVYEFYFNSIGEIPSCLEPRTLKQLSRTTIRRTLKENNFWIPEGIGLTGLPTSLQWFLNLEEVIPILHCNTNLHE